MLNPAATVICGWSAADCLGEQLTTLGLFDVADNEPTAEHQILPYRSYRMGQTAHNDMEVIQRRDGSTLPVAITATPRAEGGAVVVMRDISEWVDSEETLRRVREELETQRQSFAHMERLSTTGEMAAGIAHEVNQPLTAVTNYARVARRMLDQRDIDREKLNLLLDKLDAQCVRASEVIQRLRGYVKKPDAGNQTVDANQIIQEVIALAEVDSRINDVPVHLEPQRTLPPVNVDVVQIQQVALNLIRNAMEAMADSPHRHQGVLVRTSLHERMVTIEVIDHGVGIEQGAKEKLFQPFYSTKDRGKYGYRAVDLPVHRAGARR